MPFMCHLPLIGLWHSLLKCNLLTAFSLAIQVSLRPYHRPTKFPSPLQWTFLSVLAPSKHYRYFRFLLKTGDQKASAELSPSLKFLQLNSSVAASMVFIISIDIDRCIPFRKGGQFDKSYPYCTLYSQMHLHIYRGRNLLKFQELSCLRLPSLSALALQFPAWHCINTWRRAAYGAPRVSKYIYKRE